MFFDVFFYLFCFQFSIFYNIFFNWENILFLVLCLLELGVFSVFSYLLDVKFHENRHTMMKTPHLSFNIYWLLYFLVPDKSLFSLCSLHSVFIFRHLKRALRLLKTILLNSWKTCIASLNNRSVSVIRLLIYSSNHHGSILWSSTNLSKKSYFKWISNVPKVDPWETPHAISTLLYRNEWSCMSPQGNHHIFVYFYLPQKIDVSKIYSKAVMNMQIIWKNNK